MLTLAAWAISVWEFSRCLAVMKETCGSYELEEFLSKCTPESLWKCHCHGMMGMFTLQLASILSLR